MKIFKSSLQVKGKIKKPVVVLGNFDGIHLAHQKMFGLAFRLAKKLKGTSCVYTFHPHPVKVLSPESAPSLITTLSQKIELIRKSKIQTLILEKFSLQFAKLSPEDFLEKILKTRLRVAGIVVGYDFTFGARRAGQVKYLQEWCKKNNIILKVLPAFLFKKTLVSSSQIRNFIREGKIEKASSLLGRPFELVGKVIHGNAVGATIGFPTANLDLENELIPGLGVYATRVKIRSKTYCGATNIGYRPTFKGKNLSIETHLLNFKRKIYGEKIKIKFLKKIRDEIQFSSKEQLIEQIKKDLKAVTNCHIPESN